MWLCFSAVGIAVWLLGVVLVAVFQRKWDPEAWQLLAIWLALTTFMTLVGVIPEVIGDVISDSRLGTWWYAAHQRRHEQRRTRLLTGPSDASLLSGLTPDRWPAIHRQGRAELRRRAAKRVLFAPLAAFAVAMKTKTDPISKVFLFLGLIGAQLFSVVSDLRHPLLVVAGTVAQLVDVTPEDERSPWFAQFMEVNQDGARLTLPTWYELGPDGARPTSECADKVLLTHWLRKLSDPGDQVVFVVAAGDHRAFTRLCLLLKDSRTGSGSRRTRA
jgi:uncharacterized membrane protein